MMEADSPIISPEGSRAGRALLNWSLDDLADRSGVTRDSISRFERGRPIRHSTALALVTAFRSSGVEILAGDHPGARLNPAIE